MSILHGLTDEQRSAVQSGAPLITVAASAGSGKTRVLVYRVLHMLSCGIDPRSIMLCTFTRKAAGEMRARLRQLTPELADGVWIGTLHAYALKLLEEHGHRRWYQSDLAVSVYGETLADDLLRQVCHDLGYLKAGGTWKAGWSFKRVKGAKQFPFSGIPDSDLLTVIGEYYSRLVQSNAVDYDLMIPMARVLISKTRPPGLPSHVLIDEAQDLSDDQHDLIRELVHGDTRPDDELPARATLFMVGDVRQSIYGWRGATPGRFACVGMRGERLGLTLNFRSCGPIIHAANRLIDHNGDGYGGDMRLPPDHGCKACEPLRLSNGPDPASSIGIAIHRLIEEGFEPKDIAVLARTNRMLWDAAAICEEFKYPWHKLARPPELEDDPDFAASVAAVQLVVNPQDYFAFRRVCGELDIDRKDVQAALFESTANSSTPLAELIDLGGPGLPEFIYVLNAFRSDDRFDGLLGKLWDEFGDTAFGAWSEVEGSDRCTIAEVLRNYNLRDRDSIEEPMGEGVTLGTIHAAKGLEWPAVIVIGLDEGHFPRKGCTDAALIEERCCMFVAMTRARQKLVLLSFTDKPSRFLEELR